MSHPLRVRGLKPVLAVGVLYPDKSHPLRVRGLNYTAHTRHSLNTVVSSQVHE